MKIGILTLDQYHVELYGMRFFMQIYIGTARYNPFVQTIEVKIEKKQYLKHTEIIAKVVRTYFSVQSSCEGEYSSL